MTANEETAALLARIADALDRLAPPRASSADLGAADAFLWEDGALMAVPQVAHVPLALLKGVDAAREALITNTRAFAAGRPANNALLWGARGMGKSSLVKAVHAAITAEAPDAGLKLIEIHREDIDSLPKLLRLLRGEAVRAIVFCDDLSFESGDTSYKALKAALEGGLEGRPENVVFYATSNRRHLMARSMIENEQASAISASEPVDESVSLSDRFGLWLGVHACGQPEYLSMVEAYAEHFKLALSRDALHREAIAWAARRGARSGRVAWQFTLAQRARV